MSESVFDLAVLGGGPAGYAAAIRAGRLGGRVVLIEQGELGGVCLNQGCIPTKTLIHGASVLRAVSRAGEWGVLGGRAEMDVGVLRAKKDRVVAGLRQGVAALLQKSSVTVARATGRVAAPQTVVARTGAGETVYRARNILLCLGAEPVVPPIPGVDLPGVMTSDALLETAEIPASLAVIGAGVIGLEFACLFAGLGSRVTVIEAAGGILPMVDAELAKRLIPLWKRQGVAIETGAAVSAIERSGDGLAVRFAAASGAAEVVCQAVLVATGRRPRSLEGVFDPPGLEMDGRNVKVDLGMRTSLPGVYAAGDLVPGPMLAHAATAEGLVAAQNAMGGEASMDYAAIPTCIFTSPEIASVGLTEQEARRQGREVAVGKCPYSANGRAQTLGEPLGLVKLVADARDGKLLGAHLFGEQAGELVAEAALAVRHGLTARELAQTMHGHPTLSETLSEAAHALLGEPVHTA
jgi:dihydrolipoamide dehydrogenase